jgi:NAD(P)-dependent dehydrogenase (short-subunit alcohol dehydrogenase family)
MNQAALVTGAARGIGFGVAEALAKAGFAIALNDVGPSPALEEAGQRIAALGVPTVLLPFDITDLSAHDAALERAESAIGPLTTLVNNAGVGVLQRGDILDVTEQSWDRCHAVNAKALFFLTQRFARRLLSRPRAPALSYAIISITSSNATAAAVQRAEYAASKAAAAMVTKTFAVRLGAEGIQVFDVQPGLIETDLTAPVIEKYARMAAVGFTLMPRLGKPADVGNVVVSLAEGRLPYVTGAVIAVDGGMLVPRF